MDEQGKIPADLPPDLRDERNLTELPLQEKLKHALVSARLAVYSLEGELMQGEALTFLGKLLLVSGDQAGALDAFARGYAVKVEYNREDLASADTWHMAAILEELDRREEAAKWMRTYERILAGILGRRNAKTIKRTLAAAGAERN